MRVAKKLGSRARLIALSSSAGRVPEFRDAGITALVGDLDRAASIRRISGIATRIVHMAPPPRDGDEDPRTLALIRALRLRSPARSLVYGSTSGVYGDCKGEFVTESRAVDPTTPRAKRRVAAETAVRFLGRSLSGTRVDILRIPGIYALDRVGGTPRDRLQKGTAVLAAEDDVFTNHIHADDLATACLAALWRGKPQRVYNVVDQSDMKMGDYFDAAADIFGMRRPTRMSRVDASQELPAMLMSFMSESRRLDNTRLHRELQVKLKYPTIREGLSDRVAAAKSDS